MAGTNGTNGTAAKDAYYYYDDYELMDALSTALLNTSAEELLPVDGSHSNRTGALAAGGGSAASTAALGTGRELSRLEAAAFWPVFVGLALVGTLGNAFVVLAVFPSGRMRRGIMNSLLAFLALADLGNVLLAVPDWTQTLANRGPWWTFWPAWLCPATRYLGMVCLYASIQTQLAVCVERYVATKRPLHAARLLTRPALVATLALIWTTSCVFALPYALHSGVFRYRGTGGRPICTAEPQPATWYKLLEMCIYYALPCVFIFWGYAMVARALWAPPSMLQALKDAGASRPAAKRTADGRLRLTGRRRDTASLVGGGSAPAADPQAQFYHQLTVRRRVVCLLCTCVAIYFVCYSPIQLVFLTRLFHVRIGIASNFSAVMAMNALCYANSACNPVVYTVCSERFRAILWRTVRCKLSAGERTTAAAGGGGTQPQLNGALAKRRVPVDERSAVTASAPAGAVTNARWAGGGQTTSLAPPEAVGWRRCSAPNVDNDDDALLLPERAATPICHYAPTDAVAVHKL